MKMKKILCVIMALSLLAAVGCGDTTDTAESEPTTEATTEATIVTTTVATTVFTTKATEKTTTTEATTKASTAPQPNTTEMVDKISNDAKAAAATATPEDLQKALQSLRNYQDFFVNNDTMYYAMYNSQLLYYYYQNTNTPYEQAGFYAFAAIKYVYRGIDTTESADTVDNLSKLETVLSQCIDIVPAETTAVTTTIVITEENVVETVAVEQPDSNQSNGKTVYITRTGKKYHYDSQCNGGTYYPATLEEALQKGLEPCGKCVN